MNYKDICELLTTTALAHTNVVTSQAGILENIDFGSAKYPMVLFILDDNSSFELNKIKYKFQMICADIVDESVLQQITKQSNMFAVGRDILVYLMNAGALSTYDIEPDINFRPFVDSTPDLTAGFQFDFTLTVPIDMDCDLPFVFST